MQPTQAWNTQLIEQCEQQTGQALLRDEQSLVSFSNDFGKLKYSKPSAVCIPATASDAAKLIQFASQNQLPLTLRGNGMSQCGQSLAPPGGLLLSLEKLNGLVAVDDESIRVLSNTPWSTVLEHSAARGRVPPVVPYNCSLSVGGVISAGGAGASSFRFGSVCSQVDALEVITARGEIQWIDAASPLFHACLGGQGQFAAITQASVRLRPCADKVRTFFLVYLDQEQCLRDLHQFRASVDYIECFCSPSVQGARLTGERRQPFAQWLFALHVSVEYSGDAPQLESLNAQARPWKVLHVQDEPILSWLHRHDSRFQAMKLTGQWELKHPWYECFMSEQMLRESLDELLASLPLYYATVLQIAPMAKQTQSGFFMLPEEDSVFGVMILNPGLPDSLIPSCLETIKALDARFLNQGARRYLSGFLGNDLSGDYWQKHYGALYARWVDEKQRHDPAGIFQSFLLT